MIRKNQNFRKFQFLPQKNIFDQKIRGQKGDASFKIPVEIFYSPPMVFQLASRPKNQCFCSPNLPDGWCTNKDGVFLVDQGMAGVPLVISGPHFASASGKSLTSRLAVGLRENYRP